MLVEPYLLFLPFLSFDELNVHVLSNLRMLNLNLRPGLCLAYSLFLELFQPGCSYRVHGYKKRVWVYVGEIEVMQSEKVLVSG